MAIRSINPANGELLAEYSPLSSEELEKKVAASHEAYLSWRQVDMEKRAEYIRKVAKNLRENARSYGELLTLEMGKPIVQAVAEVEKSAWNFEHYAEHSSEYLTGRTVGTDARESYVVYEPIGTILTIMPWNYAFWQALRMIAPILMSGNVILLKHASNVPQAALLIEKIIRESGIPEGVFQTLLIASSQVEDLIADDRISGVSLTGSEHAGSLVGSQAGREIKPVVLELGGSDPSIVLEDADIQFTCETVAASRLQNNGQSCIGAKRFIVLDSVYDEFLEKLQAVFESYTVGDPMDEATMVGPIVSEEARDELLSQIDRSVAAGAKLLMGGKALEGEGFYLEPTILADVVEGVPSYTEELFGPVASVIRVADEKEAVSVANATRFGLGASIYSADIDRAKRLAGKIEAGSVFINGFVKSDPRLPFGGTKRSGLGRELSEEGIRAFTNIKTVWIK